MAASNEEAKAKREAEMVEEQARLASELERQAAIKQSKAAPALTKVTSDDFSYGFEEGMEAKIKAFRQRGRGGDAMIIAIDHEENTLTIEETLKGSNLEELADKLSDTDPRYLLYIHKARHPRASARAHARASARPRARCAPPRASDLRLSRTPLATAPPAA